MDQNKAWYASRTIWTNIVTTLATVATLFGLNVSADTQAALVTVIVAVGALVSSIFRKVGSKKIG